jgi:hypothetical protein
VSVKLGTRIATVEHKQREELKVNKSIKHRQLKKSNIRLTSVRTWNTADLEACSPTCHQHETYSGNTACRTARRESRLVALLSNNKDSQVFDISSECDRSEGA